jgi:hypothetical protein
VQRLVCIIIIVAVAGILSATASDLSPKEVTAARDLYDIKCAKCHKFYNPADYSQSEWEMWMKKMSRKAKLKKPQEQLLSRYLQVFRDTPATAPPPPK